MSSERKIIQIKESVEDELMRRPGVKGVDVGNKVVDGKRTQDLAIRVLVENKKDEKDIPKEEIIPKEIQGIKTDVIQRRLVPQPLRTKVPSELGTPNAVDNIINPLTGGVRIGPCRIINDHVYSGTLGMIVKDNLSNSDMLLSNYHVLCIDQNWEIGDKIAQPSLAHGGQCPENVIGELQRAKLDSRVDCAVSSIENRNTDYSITEIGEVKGVGNPIKDTVVRKVGAATGLTYGIVDNVDLSYEIDYGSLGKFTFRNQIGIRVDESRNDTLCDNGDSGSIIVNEDNQVIGLHFVGEEKDGTYLAANPIQDVLDALGINMSKQDI